MPIKPSTVVTEADKLFELLKEKKEIRLADAAKMLNVPAKTVEAWANFLEEEKILSIRYQFTTPYLVFVEPESPEAKKKPEGEAAGPAKPAEVRPSIERPAGAELLDEAYRLMAEDRHDEAVKAYQRLRQLYSELPQSFARNKRELESDLVKLNRDLAVAIERQAREKLKGSAARLRQLLGLAKISIAKGELSTAETAYNELKLVFEGLPPGFLQEKKALQDEILGLYERIAEMKKKVFSGDMKLRTNEINSLLASINQYMDESNLAAAVNTYNRIKKIYDSLPPGFLAERAELQNKILRVYELLATDYRQVFYREMVQKTEEINTLLGEMKAKISNGQRGAAEEAYEKIKALYSSLPEGFLAEKTALQQKILEAYEALVNLSGATYERDLNSRLAGMGKILAEGFSALGKKEFRHAKEIYDELVRDYNSLPLGFSQNKSEFRNKLLRLYSEIVINTDTPLLEGMDKDVNNKYREILEFLVKLHHEIEQGNFNVLEIDYNHLLGLYNQLPMGFVRQSPGLGEKIGLMGEKVGLYRQMAELERAGLTRGDLAARINEIRKSKARLEAASPEDRALFEYVERKLTGYRQIPPAPVPAIAKIPAAVPAAVPAPVPAPVPLRAYAPVPAVAPASINTPAAPISAPTPNQGEELTELKSRIAALKARAVPSFKNPANT